MSFQRSAEELPNLRKCDGLRSQCTRCSCEHGARARAPCSQLHLVHCDLKPSHFLKFGSSSAERWKLIDFDSALEMDSEVRRARPATRHALDGCCCAPPSRHYDRYEPPPRDERYERDRYDHDPPRR